MSEKPSPLAIISTLGRISNLPTVWTNCLAAWAINSSASERVRAIPEWVNFSSLDLTMLGLLLLGSSLLYMGGCTLNDAFDQKFDARHNPERPIPSEQVSSGFVWAIGTTEMLLGAWVLVSFAQCELIWVGALAFCIILYDAVHKHWAGSVVLMGGCRLLLWACAATAGAHQVVHPLAWIWGGALGCYVVGISMYARGESRKDAEPSRISIIFLFASPLLALAALVHWNNLDPIRVFLANITGLFIGWIVFRSILQMRNGENGAIGKGVSHLLAGICITDAVVASFCMPSMIIPCLCLYPFSLLLQKKFAAT